MNKVPTTKAGDNRFVNNKDFGKIAESANSKGKAVSALARSGAGGKAVSALANKK
jgi:hypothetical protein